MSEKLLEIKNLVTEYHSMGAVTHAVNGVSLSISVGEIFGLVGETGAGKTTTALSTLRLLPSRTARIKQGEILYNGQNLLALPEKDMLYIRGKEISMIFQDPMTSLNPVLTVGEQVYESLMFHNKNVSREELEKRVSELFETVGIPAERKTEYPHQFSGGMKQRVVIALALACSPKLLIADEPTTALDVTIQAQVLSLMADLQKRNNTALLLITHDLGIVAQMCTHVGVMYAGEIIESGTVREIFGEATHHPYTQGLFGSIPTLTSDAHRLKPIPGLMPDPTNLPAGCAFHTRCPYSAEICKTGKPPVKTINTHSISCFFGGSPV